MKCIFSSDEIRSTEKRKPDKKQNSDTNKNGPSQVYIDFLYDQIEKKDQTIERLWSILGNENIKNDIPENWTVDK